MLFVFKEKFAFSPCFALLCFYIHPLDFKAVYLFTEIKSLFL